MQCYEQEIMLLSQLSHPNIVQYYGSELVCSCSLFLPHIEMIFF